MAEPLRVGLAGLGTVGSAVASMLAGSRTALADRAGRGIELVAYSAKDPPKDATLDLSKVRELGGDSLRREIQLVIERLCDKENPHMNRLQRARLIDEVLDELFGKGRDDPEPAGP